MTDIEYKGYNFRQGKYTDVYEIFSSDEVRVEYGHEKPNMSVSEAMRTIERYILVSETVKAVMG